ncbi:MAG: hypothetical protein V7K98_08745 [Nostoc sp.]|uniref:hypothetical protein n=1 Tax=Nostoc sp. TaxID=1180 RepID=UPI002FF70A38
MPLPPPNSGVFWKSYEIGTPTFQLTPVEKPDMSPFLVHMTGKNQILHILKGENASEELGKGQGFLRAAVPEHSASTYTAKVVCFTESPTFALDFFRYRSFPRWKTDQRFGLGFDKTNLVSREVRPAIYAGSDLTKQIIYLYNHIQENQISEDGNLNDRLTDLLESTYRLLFPLLEDEPRQGYMWEREWRATNESGFIFSHEDIRIICCPQEEEGSIRDILGTAANGIQFIRAWREYDDVTRFLKRQQQTWRECDERLSQVEMEDQKIQQIRELIEQYQIAKNSLMSYQEFITRFDSDKEKIERELHEITQKIDGLQTQLTELEKNEDAKKKEKGSS